MNRKRIVPSGQVSSQSPQTAAAPHKTEVVVANTTPTPQGMNQEEEVEVL